MKFVQMFKAAAQGAEIGLDLILIGIAHLRVEIEPCKKMGSVLDEGCPKLSFGELLSPEIVSQDCLPSLLGEDNNRQLTRTDPFTIFENFEVL